ERLGPVAENVLAVPILVFAAIHEAAGHRDAFAVLSLGRAVIVIEDRHGQTALVTVSRVIIGLQEVEALVGFHPAPAEIGTFRNDADLLVRVLLNIAADQL